MLDTTNLAWTPNILNGGTEVVWSHDGYYGTGNFGTAMHVFGFTITAPGAADGTVSIATRGFGVDGQPPITSRDISTTVDGPVAAAGVPEPATVALAAIGLALVFGCRRILS